MPLFEYKCERCGKVDEFLMSGKNIPESCECGECGGMMVRMISWSSARLKGTGWERDGYSMGKGTGGEA